MLQSIGFEHLYCIAYGLHSLVVSGCAVAQECVVAADRSVIGCQLQLSVGCGPCHHGHRDRSVVADSFKGHSSVAAALC